MAECCTLCPARCAANAHEHAERVKDYYSFVQGAGGAVPAALAAGCVGAGLRVAVAHPLALAPQLRAPLPAAAHMTLGRLAGSWLRCCRRRCQQNCWA